MNIDQKIADAHAKIISRAAFVGRLANKEFWRMRHAKAFSQRAKNGWVTRRENFKSQEAV